MPFPGADRPHHRFPHMTHTLWHDLGHSEAVINESWPTVDKSALVRDEIEMVIQVNGKVRGRITVPANSDKSALENEALNHENIQKHIDGKSVKKVIVVPKKLINIVIGA